MVEWTDAAAARLRIAAKREKIAQDQFDDVEPGTKIPRITMNRIMSGKAAPDDARLTIIARQVRMSVAELLGGPSLGGEFVNVEEHEIDVAAGAGRVPFPNPPIREWPMPRDWVEERLGAKAQLRMVRVVGDSQEPELREGDALIIDEAQRKLATGMHVVRIDDTLLVKRIQLEGRKVKLVSANKAYDDIVLDREADQSNFEVIGKAVAAIKVL